MNISDEIDRYIADVGKGSVRDALNVAIAKLKISAQLEIDNVQLRAELDEANKRINDWADGAIYLKKRVEELEGQLCGYIEQLYPILVELQDSHMKLEDELTYQEGTVLPKLRAELDEAIRVIKWADRVNKAAKLNGAGAWSDNCGLASDITDILSVHPEETK
jgi:hypothetical protein